MTTLKPSDMCYDRDIEILQLATCYTIYGVCMNEGDMVQACTNAACCTYMYTQGASYTMLQRLYIIHTYIRTCMFERLHVVRTCTHNGYMLYRLYMLYMYI